MRCRGLLDDAALAHVHDHVAWVGHGRAGLDDAARRVFASAAPDEQLLFLPRDGDAGAIGTELAADLARGRLVVIASDEAYRPLLDGGPGIQDAQLRRFDAVVDAALSAGYRGVRIVADNTATLGGGAEQVARWLDWEQLADRWLLERPVSGNCYFDADAIDPDLLDAVLRRHPSSVGATTAWRLGYEHDAEHGTVVSLAGSVDAFDVAELVAALRALLHRDGRVDLSLSATAFLHHSVPFALADLARDHAGSASPGELRVVASSPPVARLLSMLPPLRGFAA